MKQRNWIAVAGFVYVLAWIIGLVLESDTPAATVSVGELVAYFQAHQAMHLWQAYLIDGLAGLSLVALAAALASSTRECAALRYTILGAGVAAGSVSLFQAAVSTALGHSAVLADGPQPSYRLLLVLLNAADTFKLLAVALMLAAAAGLSWRARALPVWLAWLGAGLAVLLVVGGLNFVLNTQALYPLLVVALPLLLIWVGGASVALLRRPA